MALTISPDLINNPSKGFSNLVLRNSGSAGLKFSAAGGAIQVRIDHVALSAGAQLAAQSAGHRQGIENAAKASSLLQVAHSALSDIDARLARMKQLAADASLTSLAVDNPAPSLVTDHDRAIMNAEFDILRAGIDTIAANTSLDGIDPFSGLSLSYTLGGGGGSGDSITLNLTAVSSSDLAAGLDTAGISSLGAATAALTNVNTAIGSLGDARSNVNSSQDRLAFATADLNFRAATAESLRGRRLTPEVSLEISALAANQILDQRGIDRLTQEHLLDNALASTLVTLAPLQSDPAGIPEYGDRTEFAKQKVATPSSAPPARAPPGQQDQSISITV